MENHSETPMKLIFRTIDLYMGKRHPSVYLNNDINFKFKYGYIYVFCNDIAIIGLKKTRMGVIACKAVQEVGTPIAGIVGETARTISGYLECWIYQRHPEFKNDRNVLYDIGMRELFIPFPQYEPLGTYGWVV
jgi:hypothetical protein